MALKFQVRSTQLDAWYAAGFRDHAFIGPNNQTPIIQANATSGVFGGHHINVANEVSGTRQISYSSLDNFALATGAFSLLMRIIPNSIFTSRAQNLFEMFGANTFGFIWGLNADQKHFWLGESDEQVLIFNDPIGSGMSFTQGVPTDLWMTWDGTTGAGAIKCYQGLNGQVPTLVGTATAAIAVSSRQRAASNPMHLSGTLLFGNCDWYLNEFAVWDTQIDPISFGARTEFISAEEFEGYASSPPSESDVRLNTSYLDHGVSKTGTLEIPSLSAIKIGVSADGGTGTYDGSDRWTDPGVSNVSAGVDYRANNEDLTGIRDVVTVSLDGGEAVGDDNEGEAVFDGEDE